MEWGLNYVVVLYSRVVPTARLYSAKLNINHLNAYSIISLLGVNADEANNRWHFVNSCWRQRSDALLTRQTVDEVNTPIRSYIIALVCHGSSISMYFEVTEEEYDTWNGSPHSSPPHVTGYTSDTLRPMNEYRELTAAHTKLFLNFIHRSQSRHCQLASPY